jgi:steroid delta-isomerase-like uncharacterized protein
MLTQISLKEIAAKFTDEMWTRSNMAIADEILHPDFTDHDPVQGQGPGLEGFRQMVISFKSAFPDLNVKNEDVMEDEQLSKLILRWTAQGTHQGEFMQIPPTNKKVSLRGIDILQVENGKIAERWGEFDALGMLAQLGVIQL